MGRDDSDLDPACAAAVLEPSTNPRRNTRPFAEPHTESDATPQSRDRCCRKRMRRRVIPMTRIPNLIPPPPRVLTDSRRTTEPTRHSLAADYRPIASLGF